MKQFDRILQKKIEKEIEKALSLVFSTPFRVLENIPE